MGSKRLTKIQKDQILEQFRDGKTSQELAKLYDCTPNTVNRTIKALITKEEYQALKVDRLKSNKKKTEAIKEDIASLNISSSNDITLQFVDEKKQNQNLCRDEFNKEECSQFMEVSPLDSQIVFESEKQHVSCVSLEEETLPDTLYLLVDKKVEIEPTPISELSEWSFLPQSEKERNAVLLFANQRNAKRNCNRNQRVIKIPNTSVFKLSSEYLIDKGITRLIIDDSLISIDC